MSHAIAEQPRAVADSIDQRVRLHDIAWADYETLLAARGDNGGVRLTYREGELELMTPSVHHEAIKTRLARLLETYAEEAGIELEGFGSWTVKSKAAMRGVEADECYLLGPLAGEPERPDIAIEVVWTRGGIDKLDVYRGLGVPEVWIWQDGALRFFRLQGTAYLAAARSALLPGLDPALIARAMAAPSQTQALAVLRSALQAGSGG